MSFIGKFAQTLARASTESHKFAFDIPSLANQRRVSGINSGQTMAAFYQPTGQWLICMERCVRFPAKLTATSGKIRPGRHTVQPKSWVFLRFGTNPQEVICKNHPVCQKLNCVINQALTCHNDDGYFDQGLVL